MHRHLTNLIRQHREIDRKLTGAVYGSPQVQQLKRLRLRLRDRIELFRRREASRMA